MAIQSIIDLQDVTVVWHGHVLTSANLTGLFDCQINVLTNEGRYLAHGATQYPQEKVRPRE